MLKSLKRFHLNLSEKLSGSLKRQLLIQQNAIKKALSSGVPFVAYSLPGEKGSVFMANPSFGNHESNNEAEVIIKPWMSDSHVMIGAEMNAQQFLDLEIDGFTLQYPQLPQSTSYMEYLDKIAELINNLNKTGGKCVVSRVDSYSDPFFDITSMAEAYIRAVEKYRNLMVYIFYTPATGCWLASTPELLFECEGNGFKTIALAGTMLKSEQPQWSDKDRNEHNFVVEDISNKLKSLGLDFVVNPTETIEAGNNIHLMTSFNGKICAHSPDEVAELLHPTPAIAGYPVNEALKQINDIEKHQRRCYCGTITIKNRNLYKSFVTLRCVEFSPKGYAFYAGGGITAQSNPKYEWIETSRKIATISSIMPKIE